jgi:hypothetical protein
MNQELTYPAKLFTDAAKSFQEMGGRNLDAVNAYMPPVAQAMTKLSLEMMRFAAARAVECSELPEKLGKCQSTPEMFRQQMAFLENMRQQYAEEWFRLMEIGSDLSWRSFRPEGMGPEASTGWSAMASWMPQAAWQKSDEQPAAEQPAPAPSPRAAE